MAMYMLSMVGGGALIVDGKALLIGVDFVIASADTFLVYPVRTFGQEGTHHMACSSGTFQM